MKEEPTINYAFALKHYNQNGRGGNRESEKKDYVDVESQKAWDAERASGDGGQDTELFLKNNSFLIENTDEHTIFVNVKTTHMSH